MHRKHASVYEVPLRRTSVADYLVPGRGRLAERVLATARTVFWNGPMGVYELAL